MAIDQNLESLPLPLDSLPSTKTKQKYFSIFLNYLETSRLNFYKKHAVLFKKGFHFFCLGTGIAGFALLQTVYGMEENSENNIKIVLSSEKIAEKEITFVYFIDKNQGKELAVFPELQVTQNLLDVEENFRIAHGYLHIASENVLSRQARDQLFVQAEHWFEWAGEKNTDIEKYFRVFHIYLKTSLAKGVFKQARDQLFVQAEHWFKKAEEKGINVEQYLQIAQIYFTAALKNELFEQARDQLFVQAEHWFERAEEKK